MAVPLALLLGLALVIGGVELVSMIPHGSHASQRAPDKEAP
jgi:hypothetical protein